MDNTSSSGDSSDDEALALLLLLRIKRKRKAKRNRKFWVHPIWQKRLELGVHDTLVKEMALFDEIMFRNYTRMSVSTYEKLLLLVGPYLYSVQTRVDVLSPSLKLMVTIRYCASGEGMMSLSRYFRIGVATVHRIIGQTLLVIWEVLRREVLVMPTAEKFLEIAEDFERLWQFPHTIGSVDGKLVVLQAPPKSGSQYFSRKHNHCVNLLAVCDANYNFTIVDVGAKGRQSDGGVFRNSEFGKLLLNHSLNVPEPSQLYPGGPIIPYFFLGDAAFPYGDNMLCPFPGAGTGNLSLRKNSFNYRLSRARRTIENTFGILVARWRIYRKEIVASLEIVKAVILGTVCLHNFIKKEENELPDDMQQYCSPNFGDRIINNRVVPGEWRREDESGAVRRLPDFENGEEARDAINIRDRLSYYFLTRGRVPWQRRRIAEGDF